MSAKNIVRLGALALLALPLAACKTSVNRGVESVHQPVVSHDAYTYDVQAGPDGSLSASEARRLDDWFASIGLGYGDQVAIVTDAYYSPTLRDGIADVVARHGMLVSEDSSAAAGAAPAGSVWSCAALPRAFPAAPIGRARARPISDWGRRPISAVASTAIWPPWSPTRRILSVARAAKATCAPQHPIGRFRPIATRRRPVRAISRT
jgi:hypothetical protein